MKTLQTKIFYLFVLAGILLFTLGSCAKKVNFNNSSIVPAARGYVNIKNDKNKNYMIQIQLTDLAEVERVEPNKQSYVVWMETAEDVTKNIGQISSSKGLFSKKLKASFGTVSSTKPTKIFITAEDDPSIQFPSMKIILTTDSF